MTLYQRFIKEYAHVLHESQGGWSYNYIPMTACKEIAKQEAKKITEKEMREFLEID